MKQAQASEAVHKPGRSPANQPPQPEGEERSLYVKLTVLTQLIPAAALAVFGLRRDWENVFLTVVVIGLTLLPAFVGRRYRIVFPPEFQFIAALFVVLTLFLGSAADFYYRFWWWDMVLHTGSGFLLGIIGFLAVFLLNHTDRIPKGITPFFLCFFAVTFAVSLGVVWEIFEYAVDCISPATNMQSRETGVVDTMQDLIVDTLGAIVVAVLGWLHVRTGRYSIIAGGLARFIRFNPRLFRQKPR